jgi:RNA polymerase sigma factor (sigma-70 family)
MSAASRDSVATSHGADLLAALIDSRTDLITYLARRLRCRVTAEDIAQDVFVRLISSRVISNEPRHLIFKAAANLACNHVRDEQRRAEIRREMIEPFAVDTDECTPERTILARDALRRLSEEMASWPARTREIFILNRYDGYSQREIAEALKLSTTSIENHMAKAIFNLNRWSRRQAG